jgi:hypothetical protein
MYMYIHMFVHKYRNGTHFILGRAYNYTLDRPPLPSTNYQSVTGVNGNDLYVPVNNMKR